MGVEGVGVTAVAVAAARALESQREDALVRDPWAASLVERSQVAVPFPKEWPSSEPNPADAAMLLGAAYIGLRTRFIDDDLGSANIEQVVILGSGLDTRPWRLAWPAGARVFTLDIPGVIEFVDDTMSAANAEPTCTRIPIAADVTDPWAARIVDAGFSPARPTHWVLEGLLPYLSAHDQRALLDDVISLSARGSHAVIERAPALQDTPEARERMHAFSAATGVPFDELLARTDPPDPAAVLATVGWAADLVSIEDLQSRYARHLLVDRAEPAPEAQRGGFVTAHLPL